MHFSGQYRVGKRAEKNAHFFQKGKEGEGERGGRGTKKHAFFWSILNWGAR